MKYKAKVKSRDKASQMTGYKRITEWQFIITILDNYENIRIEIIGRWFPTAKIAKSEANSIGKRNELSLWRGCLNEGTDVAVSKSQEQIRHLLRKYGADGINFGEVWNCPPGWDTEKPFKPHIICRFLYSINDQHLVIFKVPIPIATTFSPRGRERTQLQIEKLQTQMERGVWRAVFWAIKSRMEAVEFGIETFIEAFLSHFAIPGTEIQIGERLIPRLEAGNLRMIEH